MAAIFISIAVLALAAGFFILYSGSRAPRSEEPADHKVKIRKAAGPASREVTDDIPEGLSAIESAAILQEDDDPIDIFLDFDMSFESRLEAEDRLKEAGFSFTSSLRESDPSDINQDKNERDVDVHEAATDEDLCSDLVLTGE